MVFNLLSVFFYRAIVSYLILFDYDDSLKLSCRDSLRKLGAKQQDLYSKFFGKDCNIGIKDVMNNLVKMSVFGAHNIQWDDVVLPVKTASLASTSPWATSCRTSPTPGPCGPWTMRGRTSSPACPLIRSC